MEPTIKNGSLVLVLQWINKPQVGEIVLFKKDGEYWVKRVKELEGEKMILEGDNKADSLDSRKLGAINMSHIVGKILFK